MIKWRLCDIGKFVQMLPADSEATTNAVPINWSGPEFYLVKDADAALSVQSQEDAAFIIKACNAYGPLRKALRIMIDQAGVVPDFVTRVYKETTAFDGEVKP